MNLRISLRTGGRAGLVRDFAGDRVTIGRRADADLQLDPQRDLAVSGLHAELRRSGDGWVLRDLGSRNGTFVNGRPVEGDVALRDGDEVQLGAGGPIAACSLSAAPASAAPPFTPSPRPTERIRLEVVRQARRWRRAAAALALLLAIATTALVYTGIATRRGARQRARVEARTDSALAASAAALRRLRGEAAGLQQVLEASRERVGNLAAELERARSGDGSRVAELQRRLQSATTALTRQQLAASLDFDAIGAANRPAVAVIYVELEDGEVDTGTAFAVRADALLLTNRHVVAGADGERRPRRIAIQFAGSDQVWSAHLVATARDADLAAVQAEGIVGDVPTVRAVNARPDTLASGSPVAMIGFPLGGDAASGSSGSRAAPRPLVTAGVLAAHTADRLEFYGYGERGASGSPIFDRDGAVVGILFGGRMEGGERVVLAVSASAAERLLAALPRERLSPR